MTIRKTSLLLATTSAVALTAFAFAGMGSSTSYAQCVSVPPGTPLANGGIEGTAGPDNITCPVVGTTGGDVFGKAGDDTITTTGADLGVVTGNQGGDTIILNDDAGNPGTINRAVGDEGDDTITLNGALVTQDISGNEDEDVIATVVFSSSPHVLHICFCHNFNYVVYILK